ncbi:hypothetical protein [Flavobacterium sp. GT3R68]|uniref:hypothetical protein n=1 Tax=Flavobacterium sp. GT3R68 TaxID=2594437 RepID=UPI000F885E1D|nr:hypothetical protein [Flavobacterium sp. GT3R68]RTY95370.1 hypothetical protein EKL32_08035 [Flavobacterium sp. GSN2]TRW90890.1 hypothetical protein FNW07_08635 [Flavobacterium sp. GT3R68]
MKKSFLIASFLLLSAMSMMAQDRIFNYTYQSAVLNKGQKELEVWTTVYEGKQDYYRQIKNRVEYEVGLGKNLQVAFYLNSKQKAFFDDVTGEIVMDATEISFSNEWKYKFSDAVANKIGFAGYAEFTVATDELEIELKAILDKKIGRTMHAMNFTFEPEWETTVKDGKVATGTELKYDVNYGFSYNINKNWNLGAEIINRNVYIKEDQFTHSALFAGPTVAYNMDKFWINVSVSPQVAGLNNPDGKSGLNVDEFTKMDARLIFSYSF